MQNEAVDSIVAANLSDANVSSNGANFVTSVTGVSGSAVMSNYYITTTYNSTSNTRTTNTALITPANLSITVANDAKFVTQTDIMASSNNCGTGVSCAGGYMGATYNGFVNGENQSALSGTLNIARLNSTVNAAGVYPGVLQASGLLASNYSISYQNGDYTIVPANTLLVRVSPDTRIYGSSPAYLATAKYLSADSSSIIDLAPTIRGSSVLIDDGVGGTASFTLGMIGASMSTSGNVNVGGYNLTAINPTIGGNNFNSLMVVGSHTVLPYTLLPSQLGISGISKVYDGNINIGGLTLNVDPTLSSLLGSGSNRDQVSIVGSGTFDNRNVGIAKTINVTLALSGTDANNYVLSTNSYSADIGTITQLSSVSYVGSAGGLWSTQSNWAGGAIPTLNNVAKVIIPVGSSVVYDARNVGHIGSTIQNNGRVTFDESDSFNLSNTLTGSGVFAQTGTAPLTISGNNAQLIPGPFAGQFLVGSGSTLLAGSSNALGNGSVISNNGNFGLASGVVLPSLSVYGPVNLVSNIATTGNQRYDGPVTIAYGNQTADGAMQITAQDSDITFANTLNSDLDNRSLSIDAGLGRVTFTDTVGFLYSSRYAKGAGIYDLSVSAKNISLFADVTTINKQLYTGAVVIGDNGNNGLTRVLTSQDPSIIFAGTVDDSRDITHTLDARAISYDPSQPPIVSFLGLVGSLSPLGSLRVTTEMRLDPGSPAPIDLGGVRISASINTIGDQSFHTNAITLNPAPGSAISFNSKQGSVEFVGISDVTSLANLSALIANNSVTQPLVSSMGTSNMAVPVLAPPEAAFSIEKNYEGRVYVGEPEKAIPCDSVSKDECSNG